MSNARENVNLLTSTDWDIATLRLANWGSGAVPAQVVLKTNYVAGDGGGVFRYDSTDTTTVDDGGIVIVDVAGNRWKRQWDENNAQAVWWGATASVSADQSVQIQAGIDWLEARNRGGVLLLPYGTVRIDNTLTVEKSNITLLGHGGDQPHDGGTGIQPATALAWYGASGGGSTMVFFRTVSGIGNSKCYGGGFKRVELQCRTLADYGLRIQSWSGAEWHNLFVRSPRVSAYWLTCLVTGTTVAEAGDNQNNDFYCCMWRCIDNATTQQANGFVLDGSSNANTSINTFRLCTGQHYNGVGWLMVNCDNNTLTQCSSFQVSPGTGNTFRFRGASPTSVFGAYCNTLINCRWAPTSCIVEGTDVAGNTAGPSPPNTFIAIDNGNGSDFPVYGTGAKQGITSFDMTSMAGARLINTPFGESNFSAIQASNAISANTSVYIYNGANSNMVLANATKSWGVAVVGNDLKIETISGSAGVARFTATPAIAVANSASAIGGRNAANSADIALLGINASDQPVLASRIITDWVTWTPTITAGAGTLTTASKTQGRYARINDTVMFSITLLVTNKGTGSVSLNFTLPIASTLNCVFPVFISDTGVIGYGSVDYTTNLVKIKTYSGGDPLINGSSYAITGCYEVDP